MHIGLLTDYVAVDFTCGPALVTGAMKRNFERRGHQVTIVGAEPGPNNNPAPDGSLLFSATDFKAHPGVRVAWPFPLNKTLRKPDFDVVHSHANSLLMHYAPMMRSLYNIPCLSTNTIHLPAFSQHLIPDTLYRSETFMSRYNTLVPVVEQTFAQVYNQCDGLIVQCTGLADHWRARGLDCPVHVIPRPIDVRTFDQPIGPDPIQKHFARGARMIIVCRHAREKDIDKVLTLFARHVLPERPDASLTLIGDGPEHSTLIEQAERLGILHRCDFVGERPQRDLPSYYGHADMFVYASISETFGQVVNEALYCGLPVVGADDGLGVSYQVDHEQTGLLAPTGPNMLEDMGAAIVRLMDNPIECRAMGEAAAAASRARTHPEVVYSAYEEAYAIAGENLKRNPPKPRDLSRAGDVMWLVKDHMTPWIWKHVAMSAIGSMRNNAYTPRTDVKFDAAPITPLDNDAPRVTTHHVKDTLRKTFLSQRAR